MMARCKGCGKAQTYLTTDGNGQLVEIPTPCRCAHWRRVHAICRLCDRPVTGKPKVALYCDAHRAVRREATVRRSRLRTGDAPRKRYQERNRELLREKARAYYQQNPDVREKRNAYKREWRRLNREKIRQQKQRAALRNFRDPSKYQRAYRERIAAGLHTPKTARRDAFGRRLCLRDECRNVVRGREKLCSQCKDALAQAAQRWVPRRAA